MRRLCFSTLLLLLIVLQSGGAVVATQQSFAIIGDYGAAGPDEQKVASLVASWHPDLVITAGDNNYYEGNASTIDENIGQYYAKFIAGYKGSFIPASQRLPSGVANNMFFPTPGNADWNAANLTPYRAYFDQAVPQTYDGYFYDFVRGDVHFFAVDSSPRDPYGATAGSKQAQWLKSALAGSSKPHRVVYFHFAPYSSSARNGAVIDMRWPFKAWGATVVISGHDHNYERLQIDGLTYIVCGISGNPNLYGFGQPVDGSITRFNSAHGAIRVTVTAAAMSFSVQVADNMLPVVDHFNISAHHSFNPPPPPPRLEPDPPPHGAIIGGIAAAIGLVIAGVLIYNGYRRRRKARVVAAPADAAKMQEDDLVALQSAEEA